MFGEERTDASRRGIARERPLGLLEEVALLEQIQMFLQLTSMTRSFRSNVAEQNFRDIQFEQIDIVLMGRFIVLRENRGVFRLIEFADAGEEFRTDHNLKSEDVSEDRGEE